MAKRIFGILIIIFGFGMILYPWISNWSFQHRADTQVGSYQKKVENIPKDETEDMLKAADRYNELLSESQVTLTDPFLESKEQQEEKLTYNSIMNVDGKGMIGSVEIPKISVNLPILHGTDALTLENGIGHLKGSSFPVGGKSTHSVLTGHTGLNKAKLFTDLTELKVKDLFFIHVAGRDLAYEVCDIVVVKPEEISKLLIVPGEDLVTLVTCTPYGVNSHRLFVTGKRTTYSKQVYDEETNKNKADSQWMKTYKKAIFIGILIAVILIIITNIILRKKRQIEKKKHTSA